jgi:hypothetical protein
MECLPGVPASLHAGRELGRTDRSVYDSESPVSVDTNVEHISIDVWPRLKRILDSSTEECYRLSGQLLEDVPYGIEEIDPKIGVPILIYVLRNRPELVLTPLSMLLDWLADVDGHNAVHPRGLKAWVGERVREALPLWLDRIRMEGPLAAKLSALHIVSLYAPQDSGVQAAADVFLEVPLQETELWHQAFHDALRILAPSQRWFQLLRVLIGRIDEDPLVSRGEPPFPSPVCCVSVALLPFGFWTEIEAARGEDGFVFLNRFDPGCVLEEARYLPREVRISVLRRMVARMNDLVPHATLGGLRDIYYLLRALFDFGPEVPEYVSNVGRMMFQVTELPPPLPFLTEEIRLSFEVVLASTRLWETETNLLEIFGLPSTRERFAQWLESLGQADTRSDG